MKFKIENATVEKILWQNNEKTSMLVLVKEKEGKWEKHWKVWTKVVVNLNGTYNFFGTVSEQPSKRIKDQNGKAIYETQFNSTETIDSAISQEGENIPI